MLVIDKLHRDGNRDAARIDDGLRSLEFSFLPLVVVNAARPSVAASLVVVSAPSEGPSILNARGSKPKNSAAIVAATQLRYDHNRRSEARAIVPLLGKDLR
jgi:hypothetical protein